MKTALNFGILFAIVLFIWYVLEFAAGLHGPHIRYHEYMSYFFSVPVVIIMARALRHRRRQLTDKQARWFMPFFSFGALVSLVAALAVVPLMYGFARWVNPGFLDALAQYAIQAKGMDATLAARRFAMESFLVLHAVLILVVGTVAAFVISVVMAGKHANQDGQTV